MFALKSNILVALEVKYGLHFEYCKYQQNRHAHVQWTDECRILKITVTNQVLHFVAKKPRQYAK